jgi:general secretion pathway protein H
MQTLRAEPAVAGFTLIELMVVVVLIGLAIGIGLTLDFSNSPQRLEQQAQHTANVTELMAQEAVLSGAILGLDIFTTVQDGAEFTGMRWLRQDAESWVPADIGETGDEKEVLFATDIGVQLEIASHIVVPEDRRDLEIVAARAEQFSPEVLFLPSREITPFVLTLSGEDNIVSTVTTDIMGRVRVNEDAPAPP